MSKQSHSLAVGNPSQDGSSAMGYHLLGEQDQACCVYALPLTPVWPIVPTLHGSLA